MALPYRGIIISLVMVAATASGAAGQEVTWRSDYTAARREARETNRPLLIDFSSDNCHWCTRLDNGPLRDPAIVDLLNHRFIPLKLRAGHDGALVEALRIQGFPTLLLAAPDGKILETLEGYQDVARLRTCLEHALSGPGPVGLDGGDPMPRQYADAAQAMARSDYARALPLIRKLVADNDRASVQARAHRLLQEIERQAAACLEQARQLDAQGKGMEALEQLKELASSFPGTQAAAEGERLRAGLSLKPEWQAHDRPRRARELLGQAREDYRAQQYLCCLDRCELLAAECADLPEGLEALQLAAKIKGNPEWMRQVCDSLGDRLGTLYLALAETWLNRGQPHQAVFYLERVAQALPGTRHAEAARIRLAQISIQPTRKAIKIPAP